MNLKLPPSTLGANRIEVLYRTPWLELRRIDGWYDYVHESRCSGTIIAILPYRQNGGEPQVLVRCEETPSHFDGPAPCAITGGLEPGQSDSACAVKELYEEAGIHVEPHQFGRLGTVRPSKGADTVTCLFCLDLSTSTATHQSEERGPGDGSQGEQNAYCFWASPESALATKDPILIAMVARLRHAGAFI